MLEQKYAENGAKNNSNLEIGLVKASIAPACVCVCTLTHTRKERVLTW